MIGNGYRITVITDRLIRLEYQPENKFEDRLTQFVANRDFPEVPVEERRENGNVIIETPALLLTYDEKPFTTQGLSILLKESGKVYHYSGDHASGDFGGTARTLDETDGFVHLGPGIFGKDGYSVIDDSQSPVIENGEFSYREADEIDLYFFGYGVDYYGGLRDFFNLSGKCPMIPRFALGNWWSRYYRYTEETYIDLLEHFEKENVPLAIGVIDMDWHIVDDVDPKYGSGWTGYTWNKKFFPDYKRFLRTLKERFNLKTTVNLHPADGIRAFEDCYEAAAKHYGIDPATEEPVEFNFSNPKFRETYFEEVLNPYEKDGVDFWWMDWQQGTGLKKDVDPLILLNHFHMKDQEDRAVRPMIFSRYAGPGSHRYPVGFSGDTILSWASLKFQPYFTSTASNIGFGWWSHDIGGHMRGTKDLERLIRWIELGVFSPINRIHSSNSLFMNKEPWTLEEPYRSIMGDYLRLRHALIPYLYTMNYECWKNGSVLVSPMYYVCPGDPEAFTVKQEYGYGTELLVGSIGDPMDENLRMAPVSMLLPEGRYYDIFNGHVYRGGQKRKMYRKLQEIPVLLKAGGIVPMDNSVSGNGTPSPKAIRVLFGAGAEGSFSMYEDDGITTAYENGACVKTPIAICGDAAKTILTVSAAEGDLSLIPEVRDYEFVVYGLKKTDAAKVYVKTADGTLTEAAFAVCDVKHTVTVSVPAHKSAEAVSVVLEGFEAAGNNHQDEVFKILDVCWKMEIDMKDMILEHLNVLSDEEFLKWLAGTDVAETIKDAITEVYSD